MEISLFAETYIQFQKPSLIPWHQKEVYKRQTKTLLITQYSMAWLTAEISNTDFMFIVWA